MESEIFQTFTINQGYGNNRCSGYALAPILEEIHLSQQEKDVDDNKQPIGDRIYDRLCVSQKKLLSGCRGHNVSVQFINAPCNVFNGTCMILPSSIVNYCLSLELEVKVFCSEREVGIFGKDVFEDDCSRMGDRLCFVDGYDEMERMVSQSRYLVAFTRFKHWVSMKKAKGGYYLYDPVPDDLQGGMFGLDSFRNLLPMVKKQTGHKFFYGLIIGISSSLLNFLFVLIPGS